MANELKKRAIKKLEKSNIEPSPNRVTALVEFAEDEIERVEEGRIETVQLAELIVTEISFLEYVKIERNEKGELQINEEDLKNFLIKAMDSLPF